MNELTLTALNKSIQKWEDIRFHGGKDISINNCSLCEMFWKDGNENHHGAMCGRCPVKKVSGRDGCLGTPYNAWVEHQYKKHDNAWAPYSVQCPTCKSLATKELNFLKSLLPEEKK